MVQGITNTLKTPILLITFNRPDHTRRVFEEIKKQRPKSLFVFQDGPRLGVDSDIEKCAAVRSIFEEPLEWECELKTYYSDKNLGCGLGPATGITWFFEQVEQGIIIEDDTIPGNDFFEYTEELLELYNKNDQIKVIGSFHLEEKKYGDGSYHFSMANRNLCAWATWRRAWNDFDYKLTNVSPADLIRSMKKYRASSREIEYWTEILNQLQHDSLIESSWDIQFLMSIWLKHGIGIFPNINLSENIGFDNDATHTIQLNNILASVKIGTILPVLHPKDIYISRKADLNYHILYFQPYEYGWNGLLRLPYRINKRIKKLFGVKGSWKEKII